MPGGRVLTLASARVSDSGSYSCVAVSAVGEDRRDVVLHVHGECQAPEAAGSRPATQDGGAGGVRRASLRLQLTPCGGLSECELPQ